MAEYSHLVRKGILDLQPEKPEKAVEDLREELGMENVIKLASNETSLGPSPLALEALRRECELVHYYPDGASTKLRRGIARKLHIDPEMVLVSFGGDNVIMLIGQAFLDTGDEVILSDLTFPTYETSTRIMQGVPVKVPLKDFSNDLEAMVERITKKTKLVFLCNPNNPTGCINTRKELERFLQRVPAHILVVLDEVYCDYVASSGYPNCIDYLNGSAPIIGIRTFSKLAGLAGARIGYALARQEIIEYLNRVLEPYATSRLAQAAALASLDDEEHRKRVIAQNTRGREYFHLRFDEMNLSYSPSETNFVFVKVGRDADKVYRKMCSRGVIIRPIADWGSGDYIRVTIGTPQENETCIEVLKEVLEQKP